MTTEGKLRLVIAEDETVTREMLARLLALEDDVEVVGTARDGNQALSVTRAQHPDVLLTDIGMPGIDGIQLTETLRRELPSIGGATLTISKHAERVSAA